MDPRIRECEGAGGFCAEKARGARTFGPRPTCLLLTSTRNLLFVFYDAPPHHDFLDDGAPFDDFLRDIVII